MRQVSRALPVVGTAGSFTTHTPPVVDISSTSYCPPIRSGSADGRFSYGGSPLGHGEEHAPAESVTAVEQFPGTNGGSAVAIPADVATIRADASPHHGEVDTAPDSTDIAAIRADTSPQQGALILLLSCLLIQTLETKVHIVVQCLILTRTLFNTDLMIYARLMNCMCSQGLYTVVSVNHVLACL
ncbi:hypothetical protein V6N13_039609 [Hibiscus sabdariffa]